MRYDQVYKSIFSHSIAVEHLLRFVAGMITTARRGSTPSTRRAWSRCPPSASTRPSTAT